ncbi:MAG: hypothetical protein M1825_002659 [Sarcosagium campestre]|nr:MAG: hypothetical protein M1825_002659 [Sarcosagium campestre]
MAPVKPHWPQPSHPGLIRVHNNPGNFTSGATSLVDLPPGALFVRITTATPASKAAYSSVQISAEAHIELNSDLIYCNHSCDPSLIFDMEALEVRVVENKPLRVGDQLSFFYPSSEWDMAQPFDCVCNAPNGLCKKHITGAKDMATKDLNGFWLNRHIIELLDKRDQALSSNGRLVDDSHKTLGVTSRELSGEMGGDTNTKHNGIPGLSGI